MHLKKPITFSRDLRLSADLALAFERRGGAIDNSTHFGRGIRGGDETEYIVDGGHLYEVRSPDGLAVSFHLIEDAQLKANVLLDLREATRTADHSPANTAGTPDEGQN